MSRATFEELRLRHAADLYAAFPRFASQLHWSAAQLRTERERRMRALLATAKARPPWHSERLCGIDAATFSEEDLPSLPTMSKDDLMENFEAIVADRRVTRDVVDTYVENLPENLYLFDRYLVVASGGSSGRRGVFVYDWDEFVTLCCQVGRWMARLPTAVPAANLWAPRGAHLSWIAAEVFPRPGGETRIAPTLPLAEIVARLNTLQPKKLSGYASTLALLASESRSGRLTISPIAVATCGEPLRAEVRAEIETAWPAHVYNYYGMSEGMYAFPCQSGDAMHLPDDLHYVEAVDEAGRPVPPGTPAAKLLVTNLYNLTQPLIRYEVTDQLVVVPEPCPCGMAMRRIDHVVGRTDDIFTYPGGVRVHPLAIEAALERRRHVVEYQVVQTERGVRVRFCANGSVDPSGISNCIEAALCGCGLVNPEVSMEQVPELQRQVSGKLKRFVPRGDLHPEKTA
jgi:phenylacetate-coenzyme A ligase PaaK-like adenylate-forming protein